MRRFERRRRIPGRTAVQSALLVFAAAMAPAALQTPQPQRPVFREAVNAVLVDVYPRREGRIVEGLTRDDFEVFENGAPQVIESVEFIRVEPNPPDVVRHDPNSQREALQAAEDPRNRVFVAFLDTLHTTVSGSHAIRRPLLDTLNRAVTRNDLFGVITQNQRARDLVLGRVMDSIENELAANWTWGERHQLVDLSGVLSGVNQDDPVEVRLDGCFTTKLTPTGFVPWYIDDGGVRRLYSEALIERHREDRVISALENLVVYLGEIRNARTVLMIVTDGWLWFPVDRPLAEHLAETDDVAPARPGLYLQPGSRLTSLNPDGMDRNVCNQDATRIAGLDNPRRLRDLIEDARRRAVSIYPINPDGLTPDNLPASDRTRPAAGAALTFPAERHRRRVHERIEGLRTLAEGTDGFAVVDTNDLASGVGRIADDVSAYYLLGYYSTHTDPDGQYRTIRVNVKQPGLEVRARRGYRAAAVAAPVSAAGEGPDAAAESLEAAFGALARVRPDASLFTYGVAAAGEASVVVELTAAQALAAKTETPTHVDIVGPEGAVLATGAGTIPPGTRGAVVSVRIPEKAVGLLRANVTAGTGRDRRQDSVAIAISAHTLVGPAVVFRATPSPRSPLHPVADFLFRRTERVHVEWARLSEIDRRDVRLLGRDGKPLALPVNVTEREVNGRVSVAADLNLAPLTDGEYAIELIAGRGDASERHVVAIQVVR